MNSRDILELCFRNLLRRRARTLLSVIGVVVGTCAIVVMLSIGFGLSESYQEQVESYGNLHLIQVYSTGDMGMSMGMTSSGNNNDRGVVNEKAIEMMKKLDGVDAVTPVISESLAIGVGKYVAFTEVLGVNTEILKKFNYKVQEGRFLEPTDKNGLLFGNQVTTWFYNPSKNMYPANGQGVDIISDKIIITGNPEYGQKKPINGGVQEPTQKVTYKEYKAKGVGLLAVTSDDSDYRVYMNIDQLEEIQKEIKSARKEKMPSSGAKKYNMALIYAEDITKVKDICEELREKGYQINSATEWIDQAKDTLKMIQGILGGIGSISLFVAALGITNTMIMSIYERTKEIGIMKVIGANLRDIRKMFLIEAGLIGFLGGILGLILSVILSILINTVLSGIISMALGGMVGGAGPASLSVIPWWLGVSALAFSTVIGIVAGYYPANRAMNLSALESLRNE